MSAPPCSPAAEQAQAYLAAVQAELADLPADERTALSEDLALHLQALTAEDDDRPVAVRLGDSAAYAAELRAAACLPPRAGGQQLPVAGFRERLQRVRALAATRQALRVVGELRPVWWAVRGYLVVTVPCVLDVDGSPDFPVPTPLGSPLLGVLLVVAAVVGSFALGRRRLPRTAGVLVGAAGVVLALGSLVVWQSAWHGLQGSPSQGGYSADPAEQAVGSYPLLSRYGPVTDVLPYAADGTPLQGVLLYDQDGRPLQVGFQEWWADGCARVLQQPRAADGVPVPFSFPQSYVLDPAGTDLYGAPVTAGQCSAEVSRPAVPLPVFPAAPGATAGAAAPVPGG